MTGKASLARCQWALAIGVGKPTNFQGTLRLFDTRHTTVTCVVLITFLMFVVMRQIYDRLILLSALAIGFTAIPARCQSSSPTTVRPILKRVMPDYPVLARQINVKGNVKLKPRSRQNGTVRTFTVKGGHPILVDAAEIAIRKWKYAPATHESTELIEIHFGSPAIKRVGGLKLR